MSPAPLVVTIDGPAGVGKTTIAKRLAEALGWTYLDSGAFYRVLTHLALDEGADPEDEAALLSIGERMEARFPSDRDVEPLDLVPGADVRGPRVTAAVSRVAVHPRVREVVVRMQRLYAARRGRIVMDGRDTGTVVFPGAQVKVYLDADPAERAARRLRQEGGDPAAEEGEALARTRVRMEERDRRDRSRETAPLRPASDAWILDTTGMTLDEVLQAVFAHVRSGVPIGSSGESGA